LENSRGQVQEYVIKNRGFYLKKIMLGSTRASERKSYQLIKLPSQSPKSFVSNYFFVKNPSFLNISMAKLIYKDTLLPSILQKYYFI